MGKYKCGVFLPFYAFKTKTPNEYYSRLKTVVLECEGLGYDAVWLDDHLMYGDWQIFEPWTTLAALSAQTKTIRLGTMVTCNSHRNPALLAKTAATLDVLSEGRLEFGIGAGCQEAEHLAYGYGFPKAKVRVERLDEALEVLTKLWTDENANFSGKHYTLKDAVCEPKPIQKPHPPITVGGKGEKMLKVMAKHADRFDWGFLPSIQEYEHKLDVLESQCRNVGRNFSEIEKSCWPGGQVLVAADKSKLEEKLSKFKSPDVSLADYKANALVGTPQECIERLQLYADLEVTYFLLFFADLPNTDGLKTFAEEVAKRM